MSKPTNEFWGAAGTALIVLAILGGSALVIWAIGTVKP